MGINIANTVIADLKRFTYETALQTHSSEKLADACANVVIQCLSLNFKNRPMYIPSVDAADKARQYHDIRLGFNGVNHAELAIKYKRSLQSIYSIVKSKKIPNAKKPITLEIIDDYLPPEFIRLGLTQTEAEALAEKIARHLQKTFPGISISIGKNIGS